ncbi:MAG: hypothetical protein HZT43_02515 [Exiguobacterium profundum]|nr:MAG: hypothetical protein HZT43_02515 [Exiguobacterium profundum]
MAQTALEEALKVPGAKPTLPISAAKEPFDTAFIAEARTYWGNFHWQMGAITRFTTIPACPNLCLWRSVRL